MKKYTATISVMPLKEILDPQGNAVNLGLKNLGISTVSQVRIGKNINLMVDAASKEEATTVVDAACKKLLANLIMEEYSFQIEEVK
jgi:phosphoribosylformylglycinamidine synthase PurS subunit